MPITMQTRRLLQPYHVRFPMRTARSYKPIEGLTERCKELVEQLRVAFRHTAPTPVSHRLIPWNIQRRIYTKRGFDLRNCTNCGRLEVCYTDHNGSFFNGVCRNCAPLYTVTQDGLFRDTSECYYAPDGSIWSTEDAYRSLPDIDYDPDDDDDDDPLNVADYHCHPDRSNKMRYHEPNRGDPWAKDVIHIGFEWEYNAYSRASRSAAARLLDETVFCFGEQDGSLSPSRGLEVVTGWSTLGTVCAWARDIGTRIKVSDIEDAGLHVNVSGLTNLQMAKYITFLSRNAVLTTLVGGRSSTGYAQVQETKLQPWLYKTRRYGYSPIGTKAPETNKYSFCHIRGSGRVAEVRIFNSSKDAEEIVQRIQYAWAVAHFVRQPGMNLGERHFKAFLAENPWVVKGCRDLLKAHPSLCPAAFAKRPKKVPA